MKTQRTRLKKIEEKQKTPKKVHIFYWDYEGEQLFDRPHNEPGAETVSRDTLDALAKDENAVVILVSYEHMPAGFYPSP